MLGSMLFRWSRKSYVYLVFTSATVARVHTSTSYMIMCATVTKTWDSIAVPKVCWYTDPWKPRNVAERQNFRSSITSFMHRLVRSLRVSSACSLHRATVNARSTGTFAKSDTRSKEARISLSYSTWGWMNSAEQCKFCTCEGELPTRGEWSLVRCLDSWPVGECTGYDYLQRDFWFVCYFRPPLQEW